MPKIKTGSTQDVEFKISPWQTKKKCKGDAALAKPSTGICDSSIRPEDSKQVNVFSAEMSITDGTSPKAAPSSGEEPAPLLQTAVRKEECSTASLHSSDAPPGEEPAKQVAWISRQKSHDESAPESAAMHPAQSSEQPDTQPLTAAEPTAAPAATHLQDVSSGSDAGHSTSLERAEAEQGNAPPVASGSSPEEAQPTASLNSHAAAKRSGAAASISGTGYLVWLPDGRLSGHLMSSRGTLGIMGREVLSQRECTRDAEWKLMHVTLLNLTCDAEVGCLAEKTGEDSARLRAPFDVHGTEEHLLQGSDLFNDTSVHLEFACETILADALAEKHLARFSPSLRGRGAFVNVGPFTCGGEGLAKLMRPYPEDHVLFDKDLDGDLQSS